MLFFGSPTNITNIFGNERKRYFGAFGCCCCSQWLFISDAFLELTHCLTGKLLIDKFEQKKQKRTMRDETKDVAKYKK